jgi:hypothetical protein
MDKDDEDFDDGIVTQEIYDIDAILDRDKEYGYTEEEDDESPSVTPSVSAEDDEYGVGVGVGGGSAAVLNLNLSMEDGVHLSDVEEGDEEGYEKGHSGTPSRGGRIQGTSNGDLSKTPTSSIVLLEDVDSK